LLRCKLEISMLKSVNKVRIAWFSPFAGESLDQHSSVSAYVSAQLLPRLTENFSLDLYHRCGSGECGDIPCYPSSSVLQRHLENPYDLFFYQVADTPLYEFSRLYLLLFPGVVWFHDLYFRPSALPETAAVIGRKAENLLDDFLDCPGIRLSNESPFAFREARFSALSLFSCERNLVEFKRHSVPRVGAQMGLDPDAFLLPYPVRPFESRQSVVKTDPADMLTVAFCGSTLLEHRAHYLLPALNRLNSRWRLIWMLDDSEVEEAKRLAAEFETNDVEFVVPRSFDRWRNVVERADVAVHLLFSAYGDPGPWLAISMMAGVPCVVSDYSAAALLPDQVVWKIACGEKEINELEIAMASCVPKTLSAQAKQCSALAGIYAREHFSVDCVAEELKYVLHRNLEKVRKVNRQWLKTYEKEIRALFEEVSGALT
jgi:glycosyltransferase involved in cell wall biosynthesis